MSSISIVRPCVFVGAKASACRISARREQALRNMVWEDTRRQLEDDPAEQGRVIMAFLNQKGK